MPGIDCCKLNDDNLTQADKDTQLEINRMDEKIYQRVARMKWSKGFNHPQIVTETGLSPSVVRSRIGYTRGQIVENVLL